MTTTDRHETYRANVRRTFRMMSEQALAFQAGVIVGGIDREELEAELDRRARGGKRDDVREAVRA